jgi:hypothetical protein
MQIAAIRSAIDMIDAGTVNLPVNGALVTALKPLVASAGAADQAGFFLQGGQAGPGLFVSVDPSGLSGGLAVGDNVNLTVTTGAKVAGARHATGVNNVSVTSRNNPTGPLVSDATAIDFTSVANVDLFENRLATLNPATVFADSASAGAGYKSVILTTTGTAATTGVLKLRLPIADMDALSLGANCSVSVTGAPLWRFNSQAQHSTWGASSVNVISCPAPAPLSAVSTSATSAAVTFNRDLKTSTVIPGAFTISGLTVSAATLTSPRQVTLTTSAQASMNYTVTVASSVQDMRGTGIASAMSTAMFNGFVVGTCVPSLVISQIYGGSASSGALFKSKYVELHNRTSNAVNLSGYTLQYAPATTANWQSAALSGTVAPGGFFLVETGSVSTALPPIPTPDATTTLNIAGAAGKVALVNGTTTLTACPTAGYVDLVGYGVHTAAVACSETANAPAPSGTLAVFRASPTGTNAACTDANNNSTDFSALTPVPRNSLSPTNTCTCP